LAPGLQNAQEAGLGLGGINCAASYTLLIPHNELIAQGVGADQFRCLN